MDLFEPPRILRDLEHYPEEAVIVGRLLAGYSDVEVMLLYCVEHVQHDFGTAVKVMYRARGETQRIDVADALARTHYHRHRLGTRFEMAIGALRHCLKIRNQYAHCAWFPEMEGVKRLGFVNLEETAREYGAVNFKMNVHYLDLALLHAQHAFFDRTMGLFLWLGREVQIREGNETKNPHSWPAELKLPDLHIP
ncbi:MAG TPA: hypothetical protein VHP37_03100 [Burkholderiales bacterium]|nr:hypothetical protein [Burkholderiales bacterium]